MQKNEDLWYRVGYALERTRHRVPSTPIPSANAVERGMRVLEKVSNKKEKGKPTPLEEASHKLLEAFLAVGAGTALSRLLSFWPGRKRPGLVRLARAGAAGAAAAFLAEIIGPIITGETEDTPIEEKLTDVLLSGAGRGLLYAAVVEPRIPGHAIIQGSAYAALEYALVPWGGLEELAGPAAPHKKIPVLSVLLQSRGEEEHFLAHLAFGVALALLYDS